MSAANPTPAANDRAPSVAPRHVGWRIEGRVGVLTRERPERNDGLTAFTPLTGDLVKAMRACPQPVVAAVDGVCAGAGAILAMASDLRVGTPGSSVAFVFTRVGLAGCDMGACSLRAPEAFPARQRPRCEGD